ncbi:MAG: ion transporter [Treponema sp.]|nr:ion transporter [Treponema sp.]
MYKKLRQFVYNVIRDDGEENRLNSVFGTIIMVLIIINVLLVIIETFKGIPELARTVFYYIEVVSVIIFTVEYLLRIWTAPLKFPEMKGALARLKYMRTFMAVIDILAILPFYIPFALPVNLMILRMLRLLRLLRIMKMNRYTGALVLIKNVITRQAPQLISSLFAVFLLLVLASLLVHSVEYDAQPDVFENAFSGLWWAMATLTTVGYGDITPVTAIGKFLGTIIALLGIGLVAVPTGIISAGFIEVMAEEKAKKEEKEPEQETKRFCSYCGKEVG